MSHPHIDHGIEWWDANDLTDNQCARCGSSCGWLTCWACDHGDVEEDAWDGMRGYATVLCEYCRGTGGSWHCLSSPEWCAAHALPERAHIVPTALAPQAWRDSE